jgi:hypothetical protein
VSSRSRWREARKENSRRRTHLQHAVPNPLPTLINRRRDQPLQHLLLIPYSLSIHLGLNISLGFLPFWDERPDQEAVWLCLDIGMHTLRLRWLERGRKRGGIDRRGVEARRGVGRVG